MNFIFYIFTELDFYRYIFLTNYLLYPLKTFQRMAQDLPLVWGQDVLYMVIATFLYALGFLILAVLFFKKKEIP